jgi:hypothetical protein
VLAESEAFCSDDPDRHAECELIVAVEVPPFSHAILRLQGDPLAGVDRVVDTGSSLSAEEATRRTVNAVSQTLVEAQEVLAQERYCNSSIFISNTQMKVEVEACSQGKITLKLKKGNILRRVEFEFRAYQSDIQK